MKQALNKVRKLLEVHFIRFLIVGCIGFGLSVFILVVLHESLRIDITLATFISSEFGLIFNFISHQNWTYNSVDHNNISIWKKFTQFHLSSWSGVVILTVLETIAVRVFHFEYLISFIVAGGITMFWNFFWTKYHIFKDNSKPSDKNNSISESSNT